MAQENRLTNGGSGSDSSSDTTDDPYGARARARRAGVDPPDDDPDDGGGAETSSGGGSRDTTLDRGTSDSGDGGDSGPSDDADRESSEGGGSRDTTLDRGTSGSGDGGDTGPDTRRSTGSGVDTRDVEPPEPPDPGLQDRDRQTPSAPDPPPAEQVGDVDVRVGNQAADGTTQTVSESEVRGGLRSAIAEQEGVDPSDVEISRDGDTYRIRGDGFRGEIGVDELAGSWAAGTAAESEAFEEDDIVVDPTDDGFRIGVTTEAVDEQRAERQAQFEAGLGLDAAGGQVDTRSFNLPEEGMPDVGAPDAPPGMDVDPDTVPTGRGSRTVGLDRGAVDRDVSGPPPDLPEGRADTQRVGAVGGEPFGGDTGAFGEEGISPSAGMSLSTEEAVEARAEQEQEILSWRTPESVGDVPAAAAGGLFGFGQAVERQSVEAGEAITSAIPSAEIGPEVGGETPGEVPANLAGGAVSFMGMAAGAAFQLPGSAAADVGDQLEGEATPTEVQGGNLALAGSFGESQVEMAAEYPLSTAAGFALPGAEGVAAGTRGFRATRGTSDRVRWDDITTERGARGELPEFDTPTDAPASRAVREVETRMQDQPAAVREQTASGEGVLFHSTTAEFGRRAQIGEGASELPGLFTSPEASPLGLERGVQAPSQSGPRIGLGDYSLSEGRVPGFETRGVEAMPRSAAESGYAVRSGGELVDTGLSRAEANRIAEQVGGERVPDPTTGGFEYLTQEAPTETGLVRPTGGRTTEMEAVIAPDSQFARGGAIGVEMPGGRVIRSDIYRPVGEPARGGTTRPRAGDADATPRTAADISESARAPTPRPDVTAESVFGASATAGRPPSATETPAASDPGPTRPTSEPSPSGPSEGVFGESAFGTDPVASQPPRSPPASDTGFGLTPRSSGPFGIPSEGGPPSAPSDTPFGTPTEGPPSTTPSETPPGSPTGEPPTELVPGGPTGEPPRQGQRPRPDGDAGRADEDPIFGMAAEPETPGFTNPIAGVWPF